MTCRRPGAHTDRGRRVTIDDGDPPTVARRDGPREGEGDREVTIDDGTDRRWLEPRVARARAQGRAVASPSVAGESRQPASQPHPGAGVQLARPISMKMAVRLGTVASLLIAGCTSSERAPTPGSATKDGDTAAPAAARGASEPPNASESRSDAAPAAEPTQTSREPFNPSLLELQLQAPCPIPASTCPDRCGPVAGWRFDEANRCRSSVVVGCWSGPMNSDAACFKRADGVIVLTSSSVGMKLGPDWTGCPPVETSTLVASTAPCPDQSAP